MIDPLGIHKAHSASPACATQLRNNTAPHRQPVTPPEPPRPVDIRSASNNVPSTQLRTTRKPTAIPACNNPLRNNTAPDSNPASRIELRGPHKDATLIPACATRPEPHP